MSKQLSTLRLNLTGLCEFVPAYDIKETRPSPHGHYGHNRMKVLLVDTSDPPDAPQQHGDPHAYDLHVPVFVCPSGNIDDEGEGYRKADATFESKDKGKMSVFYLDDQDVWIERKPSAEADSLEIIYYEGTGVGCADPAYGYTSFAWVAPLAEISPRSEKVDPNCLCVEGVDSSVLARVELREGKLQTVLMAMDGDRQIVNWRFKLPDGKEGVQHRQSLADVVQLQTDFETALTLNTRLMRISKNKRVYDIFRAHGTQLQIRIVGKGQASVDAWIKNMPWAEIFEIRPRPAGPRKTDPHFAHFYKLSLGYDYANVPQPAGQCGPDLKDHQGNPSCPPARAEATLWEPIKP